MSTADYREPTNEELWSQPPAPAQPAPTPSGLAPIQPVVPPAVVPTPIPAQAPPKSERALGFVLAIVSLVLAIPLTAIALNSGIFAMVLVWVGIVAVNFAYGFRRH